MPRVGLRWDLPNAPFSPLLLRTRDRNARTSAFITNKQRAVEQTGRAGVIHRLSYYSVCVRSRTNTPRRYDRLIDVARCRLWVIRLNAGSRARNGNRAGAIASELSYRRFAVG